MAPSRRRGEWLQVTVEPHGTPYSPTWKGNFCGTIATFQDFLAAFPHFEVKQIEVP